MKKILTFPDPGGFPAVPTSWVGPSSKETPCAECVKLRAENARLRRALRNLLGDDVAELMVLDE